MYTKLDDERQAKFIQAYLQSHPNCSIKDVVQECATNRTRLKYLQSQGYFSLPKLTHQDILSRRFKNKKNKVSVAVGREYGKWEGYNS